MTLGIAEKKMETTIMGLTGTIRYILGLYRDNGREIGSYYNGLCKDYREYMGVYIKDN